jgi:hypothetical protein
MITLEDLNQWLNAPAETEQLEFKCFNANEDQAPSMPETLINQGEKCFNAKTGGIAALQPRISVVLHEQ